MEVGVLALVAFAIYVWLRSRERDRARHREQQWEIRFPTLSEYNSDTFHGRMFADCTQMLLVDETSDFDFHHARVLHLRRQDGPRWETCEESSSRDRTRAHLAAEDTDFRPREEVEETERYLSDSTLWREIPSEIVEPAYQLYLHKHDPTVQFAGSPVDRSVAQDLVQRSRRPGAKS